MKNKYLSRKFFVWFVWVILIFTQLIMTRLISVELISWFGAISCFYFGGNIASKYIDKK